ncbi:hypothetical protein [Thermoanaerobacterium thermosaccharolyticum]|uniref:hypothetical protein n=1 Tax=Thermoanaerobacterium thermosaccharolyticum TaxID=1517 RepID=UPI003DAA07B1
MADYLRIKFKVLVFGSIFLSVITLGFDNVLPSLFLKLISTISLIFSIWQLIEQSNYEKIKDYMRLANKYKNLYDEIKKMYYEKNISEIDNILQKITELRIESTEYPINKIARIWSKCVIRKEMNLEWLYEI